MNTITNKEIQAFEKSLYLNEKATVNKYVLAVQRFAGYLGGAEVTKYRTFFFLRLSTSIFMNEGFRARSKDSFL